MCAFFRLCRFYGIELGALNTELPFLEFVAWEDAWSEEIFTKMVEDIR